MYKTLKRILDIIISPTLLAFLWPLMILIALIIKIDSNGSVLYKQKRYNGVSSTFTMYKFRTMQMGARRKMIEKNENPKKLITRIGKVLRELHIDELPQLFNILKGDISFIGVRPQQEKEQKYLLKNEPGWEKRFEGSVGAVSIERLINIYPHVQKRLVKKLTNADYLLQKEKRVDYDLYYANNQSLYNDTIIFIYLIRTVLSKAYHTFFKRKFSEYDNCDKRWKNRQLY